MCPPTLTLPSPSQPERERRGRKGGEEGYQGVEVCAAEDRGQALCALHETGPDVELDAPCAHDRARAVADIREGDREVFSNALEVDAAHQAREGAVRV